MKFALTMPAALFAGVACGATVERTIVRQQWPWSGLVKVEYVVRGATAPQDVSVELSSAGRPIDVSETDRTFLTGDLRGIADGAHEILIDADQLKMPFARDVRVKLSLSDSPKGMTDPLYMIVDLVNASNVTYVSRADLLNGRYGDVETDYSKVGDGFSSSLPDQLVWTGVTNDVRYMTTHLVLRKIPVAGQVLTLGCPSDFPFYNAGRNALHPVRLTRNYWIGVFEVTQAQYARMLPGATHHFSEPDSAATRPAERVTYSTLRGASLGNQWAKGADRNLARQVDPDSWIGRLRRHAGLGTLDLPSSAQWEIAATAGNPSWHVSSGKDYAARPNGNTCDAAANEIARYKWNGGWASGYDAAAAAPPADCDTARGTARVGSYRPNAYGLYDTVGNVSEWVLDYVDENIGSDEIAEDPMGGSGLASENPRRSHRGGSWNRPLNDGSAWNSIIANYATQVSDDLGFRVCLTEESEPLTAEALLAELAASGCGAEGASRPLGDRAFSGDVSVTDYGAKGDGVADDTAAVAAAIAAAQAHDLALKAGGSTGEEDGPHAEIVFPEGVYRLDDTVFFGRDAHLRGLGRAVLRATDPTRDVLYFHKAARVRIEGLRFEGGRNQLNVTTFNHENANVCVRGCTFAGAAANAIRSVSRLYRPDRSPIGELEDLDEEVVGEFRQLDDGSFVRDERYDAERTIHYNNSTFILVEHCDFDNCARAMQTYSDGTVVRWCRVRGTAAPGGAFDLTETVHLHGLDVMLSRAPEQTACVFSLGRRCTFALEDSVFRTVGGNGVCLISGDTWAADMCPSLFLRRCAVECGGCPEGAIVSFLPERGATPLVMDRVVDTSGRFVRAVRFADGGPSDAGLTAALKRWTSDGRPGSSLSRFGFGGLSANVETHGNGLFNALRAEVPSDLPVPTVARKPLRSFTGPRLEAKDYGVVADGRTDDSGALERLLAAAAAEPGAVAVLPDGWMRVSRPLVLSGEVAVVGAGTAAFRHVDDTTAFFRASNGAKVRLEHLLFENGKHGIPCDEEAAEPTEI